MLETEIREFIKNNLLNSKNKINSKKIREQWFQKFGFIEQYNSIMELYPEYSNLTEKLNLILYGIKCCSHCGKEMSNSKRVYCSLECANSSTQRAANIKESWAREEVKQRRRETFITNNGFSSNFHNPAVQARIVNRNHGEEIRSAFLKKYGVTNPNSLPGALQKKLENYKLKHGVDHHTQRHLIPIWDEINSQEWWDSQKSFVDVKETLESYLSLSNIYLYAHRFRPDWNFSSSISQPHQKLISFLTELGITFETNNRRIISPQELDIFIPEKNLAIEINGLYWHSELRGKDRSYHLNKLKECEKKGITLLQFWDYEVQFKKDIVLSIIKHKLGLIDNKIMARKCDIMDVRKEEERRFLDENHLQGYSSSNVCKGLFFNGELVSLMSFRKPRFSTEYDLELVRFCNKIDTTVIGGASRLFKQKPNGSIISYSDRRYSSGSLYEILGLNKIRESSPSYHYTIHYKSLENRVGFQKHKLKDKLELFDPNLSEWENMKKNGYDRCWDCGTKVFAINIE